VDTVKKELETVALPPKLAAELPLTLDKFPHCELRGVEVISLQPLVGERTYLAAAVGAPVSVRKQK
jgi:hypothetical protein